MMLVTHLPTNISSNITNIFHHVSISRFSKIGVPPVLIHFSGIFPNKNHPFEGTPLYGNPHMYCCLDHHWPWFPVLQVLVVPGPNLSSGTSELWGPHPWRIREDHPVATKWFTNVNGSGMLWIRVEWCVCVYPYLGDLLYWISLGFVHPRLTFFLKHSSEQLTTN